MPKLKEWQMSREELEAIPEKEYAEMQIAWLKEQIKFWRAELKEIEKES